MIRLMTTLILFVLVVPVLAQPVTPPAPAKPAPIVPLTISVQGGELVVIDAAKAKGEVLFVYDKKTFDAKHARQIGKALILTVPMNKETQRYTVVVTSWDDKTQDEVVITVAGGDPTPPPTDPPGATPIEKLSAKVDALTKVVTQGFAQQQAENAAMKARLLALEQIKPIPPPTAKAAHISFIGAEIDPISLKTNNDPELRAWLLAAGVKVHSYTAGDPGIATTGLTASVAKAGGYPCFVIQDSVGNVIGYGKMNTVENVKAAVTAFK